MSLRFKIQCFYSGHNGNWQCKWLHPLAHIRTILSYKADFLDICCDQKARMTSVQSFTLWQQATIEITCHDHSIIACSRHIYMGVIHHAHPVCGDSHTQSNASGEVATISAINWWGRKTLKNECLSKILSATHVCFISVLSQNHN